MSAVNRYVERVLDQVIAPQSKLARLEADLRARFTQGMADGESEALVLQRLGTPDEVADAFMVDVALDYASFVERMCAFLADMGVFLFIALPIFAIFVGLLDLGNDAQNSLQGVFVTGIVLCTSFAMCGVFIFYFPVLESRFGGTLGKRLMDIEVRSEKGARIGLGAAFLRRLPMYFEFLVLDALFIPFTQKRQRAFDVVAKTVVVRKPDRTTNAGRPVLCVVLFVGAFVSFMATIYALMPLT